MELVGSWVAGDHAGYDAHGWARTQPSSAAVGFALALAAGERHAAE
jgi:hypothetical protein